MRYGGLAEMLSVSGSVTEVDSSATEAAEQAKRPEGVGVEAAVREARARARALVRLHEAGAILLAAGDMAGVRAVHGAMGVLLGARDQETTAREAHEVTPAIIGARRVRHVG